jgi:hypothetical protein
MVHLHRTPLDDCNGLALNVRCFCILCAEIPPSFYLTLEASCLYARGSNVPLVGLSEFATQHALPPRQFLVLTASGLLTYIKSRPVDELRKLLAARIKSTDDSEIQRFFAKVDPALTHPPFFMPSVLIV